MNKIKNFPLQYSLQGTVSDLKEKLIGYSREIGVPFDQIRVDLYLINNRIYFGELTHYPMSGRDLFTPVSYNFELGSKWKIVPKYWEQN